MRERSDESGRFLKLNEGMTYVRRDGSSLFPTHRHVSLPSEHNLLLTHSVEVADALKKAAALF
jgi:hypothetical protein